MDVLLQRYCRQTVWTDPGRFVELYADLPDGPHALCAIPRNVMIHNWEATRDGLLLGERRRDLECRSIAEMLSRIEGPARESLRKQRDSATVRVVDCRHFSTLLCSILRHKQIPARVRFGFAAYIAGPGADPPLMAHAVCEWWDADRGEWQLSDADVVQHVAPEQFVTAAQAWRLARAAVVSRHTGCDEPSPHHPGGEPPVDAEQFGYSPAPRGLGVIAAELIRDAACRAGFEPLYGDSWGLASELYERPIQPDELALFDHLAAADDTAIADILAAHPGTAIPAQITHFAYARGERYTVDLAMERIKLQPLGVSMC